MKKISLFGAVSTGVGMLIATSCFFRRQAAQVRSVHRSLLLSS